MSELTRGGVCYDLLMTPFTVSIVFNGYEYEFFFTSQVHRFKFLQSVNDKQGWMSDSFTRRFHFSVDASIIATFQFYSKVESRGFRVKRSDGVEYRSLSELKFRTVIVDADGLQMD